MVFFAVFKNGQIDIRIAAHISFFQIAVRNTHIAQDFLNRLHKQRRFFRRIHIGLRNDFDERGSGAVVIDVAVRAFQVKTFADVFFQVNAFDTHAFICAVYIVVFARKSFAVVILAARTRIFAQMTVGNVDVAVCTQGHIVLGYLIALG